MYGKQIVFSYHRNRFLFWAIHATYRMAMPDISRRVCTRWSTVRKQSKMSSRRSRPLAPGTILLVLVASAGIASAALFSGLIPDFRYGVHMQSPTATYSGYLAINYVGIYHYVHAVPVCRTAFPPCVAHDEALFLLNAKNGTIRLIFYCGSGIKYYCDNPSQLPFRDGACLHVKGTLLEPSEWPSHQFNTSMHFDGDLYVIDSQTLPEISCS
jgi:hypothetical protein